MRRKPGVQQKRKDGSAFSMSISIPISMSMPVRQRVRREQAEAAPRHPGELVPVEERRPGQPWFGTGVQRDPQQACGGREEQYGDRDAP
ncbi:hypothetical protein GCM10022233_85760 [Streptomyces shaanxiensis]|uniref:Uncharacterized protein n=1 Tax=Streptomyces shaanxiensis TaxID=653357 RepID=A0ABP7WI38_9ACTN